MSWAVAFRDVLSSESVHSEKLDLPCDAADTTISDCEARAGGSRCFDLLILLFGPHYSVHDTAVD